MTGLSVNLVAILSVCEVGEGEVREGGSRGYLSGERYSSLVEEVRVGDVSVVEGGKERGIEAVVSKTREVAGANA